MSEKCVDAVNASFGSDRKGLGAAELGSGSDYGNAGREKRAQAELGYKSGTRHNALSLEKRLQVCPASSWSDNRVVRSNCRATVFLVYWRHGVRIVVSSGD